MTIHLNHSHAGRHMEEQARPRVSAPAVWEPSGFREGSAAERGVRTLRPSDRTQHRDIGVLPPRSAATWEDRARKRRDTWRTYLIGALFGAALIGASALGDNGEQAVTPEQIATSPVDVRDAR
ncbi:MAG: hypothetical protein Q4G50_05765 [Corynebacterium sp.]|uniref:hypothetical protein n=1 Tax=Corynebacterium sp. TaxID=1720 RepID=UPI0026DFA640|nr:hypothetical protein [Corynebacterium sp.]MDO5669492.1 hypothetical protein [Corynebacterium sp.]